MRRRQHDDSRLESRRAYRSRASFSAFCLMAHLRYLAISKRTSNIREKTLDIINIAIITKRFFTACHFSCRFPSKFAALLKMTGTFSFVLSESGYVLGWKIEAANGVPATLLTGRSSTATPRPPRPMASARYRCPFSPLSSDDLLARHGRWVDRKTQVLGSSAPAVDPVSSSADVGQFYNQSVACGQRHEARQAGYIMVV
jgi:hypothetical protein